MTRYYFRKEFARRAGISAGLLDYYEAQGLVSSDRHLGRNNLYSIETLKVFLEALRLRKRGVLMFKGHVYMRAATGARYLGCSRQLLSHYVRTGRLVPPLEKRGVAWYTVEQLDKLAAGYMKSRPKGDEATRALVASLQEEAE